MYVVLSKYDNLAAIRGVWMKILFGTIHRRWVLRGGGGRRRKIVLRS